ncbi:MAG TPA: hypothetical protein VLF91_02125 [Candidatus Saccharimonadales bacterium]|nr:hypothetical protein [Candidatus Saccharimonadales bacterium]
MSYESDALFDLPDAEPPREDPAVVAARIKDNADAHPAAPDQRTSAAWDDRGGQVAAPITTDAPAAPAMEERKNPFADLDPDTAKRVVLAAMRIAAGAGSRVTTHTYKRY